MSGSELAGVIAAVLVIGVLGLIAALQFKLIQLFQNLHGAVKSFEERLPSAEALAQLAGVSRSLGQSLDAHRGLTGKLPQIIGHVLSQEVKQGITPLTLQLQTMTESLSASLTPLTQALSLSQHNLSEAIMTLNQDGALTEWVDSFRDVTEPFQIALAALDNHYRTADRILESLGKILTAWADQKQAVEQAFTRFATAVEEWIADETAHFRQVEQRIMDRLEEVAETNHLAAQSLSALQTAQTKMSGAQQHLAESLAEVARQLPELIQSASQTQAQHRDLMRIQSELQRALAEMQEQAGTRQDDWEGRFSRLVEHLESGLKKMETRYTQLASNLDRLAAENERLISDGRRSLGDLPSGKMQLITAALLGVGLLLAGIMAYGVYYR